MREFQYIYPTSYTLSNKPTKQLSLSIFNQSNPFYSPFSFTKGWTLSSINIIT